jgi:hypothetical protein
MFTIGCCCLAAVVLGLWAGASGKAHPKGWIDVGLLILLPAALSAVYLHGAYSVWGARRVCRERRSASIFLASAASLVVAIFGIKESIIERSVDVHPLWVYLACWGIFSAFAIAGGVVFFKSKAVPDASRLGQ